jgi:hypothetical protein
MKRQVPGLAETARDSRPEIPDGRGPSQTVSESLGPRLRREPDHFMLHLSCLRSPVSEHAGILNALRNHPPLPFLLRCANRSRRP